MKDNKFQYYAGGFEYNHDKKLKMMHTQEGYVDIATSGAVTYTYHYYLKDHLGNTRVVFNPADGVNPVKQLTDYYPFGLSHQYTRPNNDNKYLYNQKELQDDVLSSTGLNWYDYGARFYDPLLGRWHTVDPLAEKYYPISPYAYVADNPIIFIDPNGMDIYRYDDKTGEFSLYKKTDDNFDQVGRFKYDKKTGEYTLQTNKKGEGKTRIDNVEKGVLSDGINFKENNKIIAVGGEGQATVNGVEAFAVNLSDMVGKEVGGAYFSKDGSSETTHITIGAYKNNKIDVTKGHGHSLWNRMYPDSKLENSLTGFFHTHPSYGYSVSARTSASRQDKDSRDKALKVMPNMQFYILTHPVNPGGTFPYKIRYTNAW